MTAHDQEKKEAEAAVWMARTTEEANKARSRMRRWKRDKEEDKAQDGIGEEIAEAAAGDQRYLKK